ncbi:hypothetical protein Cri9333_0751 [Crinalium epipsammum PCC 9333]|uniref:Uncharacterized protein n=1 Tax=Crinalium epipsammum PCC 9333 TaxID=1173022 RepID=K9VU92_9CYAN|nr:hypothetical protein [Crinalium epipsammum]AFZ11673.1 hypothetical protein Cri9333_0751 [Crinalium epipsammum PCC 9333]
MSEYQYYEFQTIDRPLNNQEQELVSQISSRGQVSATRAVFTYSYGDFRGNHQEVLVKYFDAMFYIANWGTKQLMLRFPQSVLNIEHFHKYCVEDYITISFINKYAILDIRIEEEEGCGWIEEKSFLSAIVGLRNDLLNEDYCSLYLAWLKVITLPEVEIEENELEPPVPAGLNKLSGSLTAFKQLFEVDEYLLKAAAKVSHEPTLIPERALIAAIKKLTREECNEFLIRLAQKEANLSVALIRKLSTIVTAPIAQTQSRRSIKQLFKLSKQEQAEDAIQQKQAIEAQRLKELETLAQREMDAWEDVERLIQTSQARAYDQVVQLLLKLQDLATYHNQQNAFQIRLNKIYEQYSKRTALLQRLQKVRLYKQKVK